MVRRAAIQIPGWVKAWGAPEQGTQFPLLPRGRTVLPTVPAPGLCVCSLLVCVKDGLNAEVKNTIVCVCVCV